jgi:chemotaxis protein CheC
MTETFGSDSKYASLQEVIQAGFENAAKGFSGMLGSPLAVANPEVRLVPIQEVPMVLGGPDSDAVGIYLRVQGDLAGQVMMIIPYEKSMEFVDMLMDMPKGTTTELGRMERSALSEVGNLTGAFFLNAVAEITGITAQPTPPAVMVDMVGSITDVLLATMPDAGSQMLMFQATFTCRDREIEADFWVIPDSQTLDKMLIAGRKKVGTTRHD